MITIDCKKGGKKIDKNILDSDSGDSRAQWLQASETEPQHNVLDPGLILQLNPEEMKGKMPKVVISSVHNLSSMWS